MQPSPVQPSTVDKLRQVIKTIENKGKAPSSELPLYDPTIHRPGDRVLIRAGNKLVETVIPELDAGGQPVPNYD